MLIPAQRHELIQKHLADTRIASCTSLAELLDVSESTIRRDLEWLESEGVLERTRGGAILSQRIRAEAEYIQREQRFSEQKQSIGKLAAALINPGDVVFINSGTTTAQIFPNIIGKPNITAITNNTAALTNTINTDYELVMIGGTFLPRSKAVVGLFSTDNLEQVYATKTFIGVEGISLKYGCTVSTYQEAEIIRLMIEHTQGPVIIVTDHSKWGALSNHLIAKIDQIHKLITDEGFDLDALTAMADKNVEVIITNKD
jgi:DeoR family fructose operon transcriptional repressor